MQRFALGIHFHNFRVAGSQPWRGSGRRRPKNDGNVALVQRLDRTAKPGKIKLAFCRLHQGPGKLRDAHVGEARIGHHLRVFFPPRFRCLIGVVVDAQQQQ